jgi:hypothetical protein
MTRKGLEENGVGIVTIRKIRLIHAAIRNFIKAGKWDAKTDGMPINQEDMALTLMSFSISLIDGLSQLGIEEDNEKLNAYFERWNAIATLLGIDDDLLPGDMQEGRELLNRILYRQARSSEEGRLLTQALVNFSKEVIPGNKLDVAPGILIHYLIGEEYAKILGIKIAPGCLGIALPAFISTMFNLVEKLEEKSPKIKSLSDSLSGLLVKGMVGYFDIYKKRQFEIPSEFAEVWNL